MTVVPTFSNKRTNCSRRGIRLIDHRPAWTDGLHHIVSVHDPQGRLRRHHHCLIRLHNMNIHDFSQTMWWKLRSKIHWAYVVGYGSNYHPRPHLSPDIFGREAWSFARWPFKVKIWCRFKCFVWMCLFTYKSFILRCLSLFVISAGGTSR